MAKVEDDAAFILEASGQQPDPTLAELRIMLAERGLSTSIATLWRFFDRHGIARKKKTSHATEEDRPDVLKRREEWLEGQLDLDPDKLVFINETFIRRGKVTDGARFDGRMLLDVVTNDNTASDVWADTAYRSRSNEAWLRSTGRVSRVHRKKPKGKPMPARTARANAAKSTIRARIEHVFARQKDQMWMFIRTIGIARAETKITLANLVYNIDRLVFHERRVVMG